MGPKTEPTRSTLGGVLKHTTIRVPYVLLSEPQFPHFHRVGLRMEGEAVCGGSRTVPGPGLALLPACAGVLARSPGETGGRSIVGTPGTGPPGEQWPVSLGCYGLMSSMLRLLKKQKEKKKKTELLPLTTQIEVEVWFQSLGSPPGSGVGVGVTLQETEHAFPGPPTSAVVSRLWVSYTGFQISV